MSGHKIVLVDLRPLGVEASVAPRLPALEQLLAQAAVGDAAPDWREFAAAAWPEGVLARAGAALPVASTIAAAAGLAPGPAWYVATPLHLVAGLNHVRVHPAGPLLLDEAAREALVAAHGRDFAGSGTALVNTPHGLLWQAPAAAEPALCVDPEAYTGRDIGGALPSGAGAPLVRRMMTELQMWLHDRAEPGATLAPNALWLWGASAAPVAPPAARPRLNSDDAYLRALYALSAPTAAAGSVETWRVAPLGREGDAFALAEQRYFAALKARLDAGRLGDCELWFGGRVYRLARLQRLKVWRRAQPWWSGQPAC